MRWLRFFRRGRRDRDFAAEIEHYLAQEIADNLAAGMAPSEAQSAARRKFGNITLLKEKVHEMNTLGFLETLWHDLRYALRLLRLDPGFTSVAVLSLALGIGANTAIFQLIDAVRLRTLPVPSPRELTAIKIAPNGHCCVGHFSNRQGNLTYPLWTQIRDHQQGFSSLLAFGDTRFDLTTSGEIRYADGLWVSGEFFGTLGVNPALGRVLTPADDRPGCGSPGAVLSYAFWQREFGGDTGAIGRKLALDGHTATIVGVAPASFFGVEVGHAFDVAVPLCAEPLFEGENSNLAHRDYWWLGVLGRLKPGWTLPLAIAQLESISPGIFQATLPPRYPADIAKNYLAYKLTAIPAAEGVSTLRKTYDEPLLILLAIAGLVLLIACANLANLMLARASTREREIAIRLAIGASRPRLIRQLLAESLLLAFLGAAAGTFLAQALSRYLVAFLGATQDPIFVNLSASWDVLGFTAALGVLTCILFGLTPAIRATGANPVTAMKASSRGLTAGRERFSLRRALVVSQVALSLVLLVGALLFVRSLQNLTTLDAGFREHGLLIAHVDATHLNYPKPRRAVLFRELLDRLNATPGVESAATAAIIPISGSRWNNRITFAGHPNPAQQISDFSEISAGYFATLGTPILAGRDFNRHDTLSSPKVAIVNEAFVRKFLPGSNPLGVLIRPDSGPTGKEINYQIVAVTRNAKYLNLRDDFTPTIFLAASQDDDIDARVAFLIRSQSALGGLLQSVKRAISGVDNGLSMEFRSFDAQIQDSLIRERLMATLSAFFGFLAAVLATLGLYGVISYMVARRRNEIGIRMALGADRYKVLRLVLGEAGVLLCVGLAIGIALSVVLARTARALLYGLEPHDPLTILLSVLLLAAVSLPAGFLPARRASRLDPMTALRDE